MTTDTPPPKPDHRATDIANQQFGNWAVLHRVAPTPEIKSKGTLWMCQCGCGTLKPVNAAHLKKGKSTSSVASNMPSIPTTKSDINAIPSTAHG